MGEAVARRRLAAILAADVVGYSRLMETAEAATLARLKAHRAQLIDPLLASHGGRLIKLMGDGALVEFPSVVEAVACAVDIQRGMAEREAGRPGDEAIRLRIGINLGDVLVDGDDLYGDGVNIAARLEGLAEPGGIVLSAAAFDQVVGKLPVTARDLGEQALKNIARPVHAYAIGEVAAGTRPIVARKRWPVLAALALLAAMAAGAIWTFERASSPGGGAQPRPVSERPVIAVLPFANLAESTEAYFSDGLTEDVAGALAKFGDLAVIDSAASLAERDRNASVAEIGRELGAQYLVRGSVRRDGPQVRVGVQLVEAGTGALLWSQRYDVALSDIFHVQDDITRQVAGAMAVRLDQLELARIATKPPGSLEAYDLVLRGRQLLRQGTRASNREARAILAEAVAKDPSYAPAQVALGDALREYGISGWTEFPEDASTQAERAAHAALALDPGLAGAHRLLGDIFMTRHQYDLALAEYDRAIAANPSDAGSYLSRGDGLLWVGDQTAAVASLEAAQKLNPGLGYGSLGGSYYLVGRYADAIAMLDRGLPSEPVPFARAMNLAFLAASQAQLGNAAAAARARAELAKVSPFFDRDLLLGQLRSEADRAHLREGLAKAGIGD
ncbi:MAG: adenylate/guanylate cyclase domain-containing protein [Geminicoccaceae bacterium]